MGTPYKWEVGASGEFIAKNCRYYLPPYSASIQSADPGRKIEISNDGGASWVAVELDTETDQSASVVINARVTNIKFTGVQGDTARIIAP